MLEKNKIDVLFQNKLKDISVVPEKDLWDAINAGVEKKRKKSYFILPILSAASILLFGFLTVSYLWIDSKDEINNTFSKTMRILDDKDTSGQYILLSDNTERSVKLIENEIAEDTPSNKTVIVNKKEEFEKEAILKMKKVHFNEELYPVKTIIRVTELIDRTKEEQKTNIEDEAIIAFNKSFLTSEEKETTNKWALLGQLSSAYSKNTQNTDNISEKGTWSYGGGVKVNFNTGGRITFGTGLMYSKLSQNEPSKTMFSMANRNVSDNLYSKIQMYSEENTAGALRSEVDKVKLENNFEVLEIPMLISYKIIDKKFDLSISSGLSSNIIIGSNSNMFHYTEKYDLGKLNNVRLFNFSTNFSVGLEYSLNDKLHVNIEPGFKYYINSFNKDNQFSYKPYSLGLNFGVDISF